MIKTQKLVPEVYYNRSRDFQLLGRIYDIVFNYIKSGTELISNSVLTKNTDDQLIDLISLTLGFKHIHQYNIEQLKAICSIFMLAIRNKGSLLSINLALYSVLHAANIFEEPYVTPDPDIPYVWDIYISSKLEDITLLLDVFDYILPAGISLNIIRKSVEESTVIIDKYKKISKDNVDSRLVSTSRYVGIVPQHIGAIEQTDLGPGRNDSMTIPTHKEAEIVYPKTESAVEPEPTVEPEPGE